jgi:hypothetical protein
MDLPQKQKIIDFEFLSEFGKKYEGQFTILCRLNVGAKHSMELEKSRLLGSYVNPTSALLGYAEVLSNLRAKIVDAPEWWKQSLGGATLEDEGVLYNLYEKIIEAEKQWKDEMMKKAQPAEEKSSQ